MNETMIKINFSLNRRRIQSKTINQHKKLKISSKNSKYEFKTQMEANDLDGKRRQNLEIISQNLLLLKNLHKSFLNALVSELTHPNNPKYFDLADYLKKKSQKMKWKQTNWTDFKWFSNWMSPKKLWYLEVSRNFLHLRLSRSFFYCSTFRAS